MVTEPVWVPRVVVDATHHAQLQEHGGAHGTRDENGLEAALARPRQWFAYGHDTVDLADLAAAYAHGITAGHVYTDGNKRTGFVVAAIFLELNGYDLDVTNEDVEATMLAVATSHSSPDHLGEAALAAWFRDALRPLPPDVYTSEPIEHGS